MKPIRFALGMLALCTALPAAAVIQTTYNFNDLAISATNGNPSAANKTTATSGSTLGKTTWLTGASQYGDGGTNYGNSITWGGSTASSTVNVSAWSTTNVTANGNLFEKAWIGNYGGDLGVTGQPSSLANAELDANHNTSPPQHALDNVGAYDALLFSFQSAVSLTDVSIGYPPANSGLDSDSTILYWNGTQSGAPSTNLTARTVGDLTANGWSIATNIGNMAVGNNATLLSPSISSQYWMVGAYMNLGGPSIGGALGAGNDYLKVNGLTVTPRVVPEPGSLALFGIAAVALFAGRRRGVRKA